MLEETKLQYARERKELVDEYEQKLVDYREKVDMRDKVIKAQEKALSILEGQFATLQRRLNEQ